MVAFSPIQVRNRFHTKSKPAKQREKSDAKASDATHTRWAEFRTCWLDQFGKTQREIFHWLSSIGARGKEQTESRNKKISFKMLLATIKSQIKSGGSVGACANNHHSNGHLRTKWTEQHPFFRLQWPCSSKEILSLSLSKEHILDTRLWDPSVHSAQKKQRAITADIYTRVQVEFMKCHDIRKPASYTSEKLLSGWMQMVCPTRDRLFPSNYNHNR